MAATSAIKKACVRQTWLRSAHIEVTFVMRREPIDPDLDAFWAKAKANLRAGRIRMLFVADRIPADATSKCAGGARGASRSTHCVSSMIRDRSVDPPLRN